jgi:hypothetical protein
MTDSIGPTLATAAPLPSLPPPSDHTTPVPATCAGWLATWSPRSCTT